MKWKDENLETYPKIIDKALSLGGKEQEQFVAEYVRTGGPYALHNIGYFSGYYGPKEMQRIQKIFNTIHPIFGPAIPSAEEALEIGKKMALDSQRGQG